MNFNGSVWRKWDLHIHSPTSVFNNNFEGVDETEKWDKYLAALEAVSDVSVLGITDYYSIEGYLKALAYKQAGRLKNIDLLIPNVELRLLPITEKNKPINLHILFSPEIVSEIDSLFFSNLEYKFDGNSYKCTRTDLIRLGRAFLRNQSAAENVAYHSGAEQFKTTVSELQIIADKNQKLRQNMIIAVSNSNNDGNSGIQHSGMAATRQEIYRFSDIIFSGNPNDRIYFLGKGTDAPDTLIEKYGSLKPCVHGSDAHELAKICLPDMNRYTWIKADPTFDGLKQICYEPEFRVLIQDQRPIEPPHRIDKVSFDFPTDSMLDHQEKFCLTGTRTLNFNPNFNCIIGGRGTGKSTILNLMHRKVKKHENAFFSQHSIITQGNQVLDIEACITLDSSFDERYIEFINQNEIEEFAKNYQKLTDAIYNRIVKADGQDELAKAHKDLDDHLEIIAQTIEKIKSLQSKTETRDAYARELDANRKIVQSFSSQEYKTLSESVQITSQQLSRLEESEKIFNAFYADLRDISIRYAPREINNKYEKELEGITQNITEILAEYTDDYFADVINEKEALAQKLREEKEKLTAYLKKIGLTEENLKDISNAQTSLNRLETNIKNLDSEISILTKEIDDLDVGKVTVASNEYVAQLKERLKPLSNTLANLNTSLVKPISLSHEFDRTEALEGLFAEFEKFFGDKISQLSGRFSWMKEYILRTNPEQLAGHESFLQNVVDGKRKPNQNESIVLEIFKDKQNFEIYKLLSLKHFLNTAKYKKILVEYDNRNLTASSFGQRCTAALVILLLLGNNPIIIDEPEAHLDSLLISNYLVEIIKRTKVNRQIIFATHNANFVINGDADLIHILDVSNENLTDITSTTIENTNSRGRLIGLEGGEKAFYMREHRYSSVLK